MCIYAVDFVIIKRREEYWAKCSDDEILEKVFEIVLKYDKACSLSDKNEFINNIQKLNEYHLEFRIACFREGVKNRLKEIMTESKKL